MTISEVVSIIAVMIALGSLFISVKESKKTERKLSVILEYVYFCERYQLVITNSGYRPVKIINIRVSRSSKDKTTTDSLCFLPASEMLDLEDYDFSPFILGDGETREIRIGERLNEEVVGNNLRIDAELFDAEGNKYIIKASRKFNPKSRTYSDIVMRESLKDKIQWFLEDWKP